MYCQYCGAEMSDNARFCSACGKQRATAAPQEVCPNCGQFLEPDSVFCDNCGQKLAGAASSAPSCPPSGSTHPTYTDPATSRRRGVTVTAAPAARIFGIPVRGKAAWIVLGVLVAAVVGAAAYAKLSGGGEEKPSPTAEEAPVQTTVPFTAREEAQPAEDAPDAEAREPEEEPASEGGFNSFAARAEEFRRAAEEGPAPAEESASEPYDDWSVFSTYETSTLEDFLWATYDVLHGGLPGERTTLTALEQIQGGWKCYLVDDPEGVFDSPMERLLKVLITGEGESMDVTFDWDYVHNYATDEGFDEDTPDTVFSGSMSGGVISALGYGKVTIDEFYYLDGREYAVGTFMWEDGVTAAVFLVRP